MAFTKNLYRDLQVIKQANGLAVAKLRRQFIPSGGYQFSTVGDKITFHCNYLSQISSPSGITINSFTENETGTRLFTVTFQYSIDGGTTYSTEAAISGITSIVGLDGKKPLHLRIIYTRSGADATGTLILNGFEISFAWSSTYPEPWRWISPLMKEQDADEYGTFQWTADFDFDSNFSSLVESFVSSNIPRTAGSGNREAFQFYYGHPNIMQSDYSKMTIFLHDFQFSQGIKNSSYNEGTFTFRIGIKRGINSKKTEGAEVNFSRMKNQIKNLFSTNYNAFHIDSVSFMDNLHFGVTLGHFGVNSSRIFGDSNIQGIDESVNGRKGTMVSWETLVEWKFATPNLNIQNIY